VAAAAASSAATAATISGPSAFGFENDDSLADIQWPGSETSPPLTASSPLRGFDDETFETAPSPRAIWSEDSGTDDRPASRRRIWWAVAGSLALVVVLAGLAVGLRSQLVAAWPPSARLFQALGMPVQPPSAGLRFQGVRSEQHSEDGAPVLLIEGQITNSTERPLDVPTIEASGFDKERKLLHSWIIPPGDARLLPGGVTTFRLVQPDAGPVASVTVTFSDH